MSTITFQKAAMSDLVLERGRLLPFSPEAISINQDMYLTESNNAKTVKYGDNLSLVKLSFNNLTKDNYDGTVNGLKIWFENALIDWTLNSFTMIDEAGIINTVRLWQKDFTMPLKSNSRYLIGLTLKLE